MSTQILIVSDSDAIADAIVRELGPFLTRPEQTKCAVVRPEDVLAEDVRQATVAVWACTMEGNASYAGILEGVPLLLALRGTSRLPASLKVGNHEMVPGADTLALAIEVRRALAKHGLLASVKGNATSSRRMKPATEGVVRAKNEKALTPRVQHYLNGLVNPIHQNARSLHDLFAELSTRNDYRSLRERQESSALLIPRDIQAALQELRGFMTLPPTPGERGSLHLVVGERGAGKTTLVHYAAQQARQRRQRFLFFSIDHQFLLFPNAIDNRSNTCIASYLRCAEVAEFTIEEAHKLKRRILNRDTTGMRPLEPQDRRNLTTSLCEFADQRVAAQYLNPDVDIDDLDAIANAIDSCDTRLLLLGALHSFFLSQTISYREWLANCTAKHLSEINASLLFPDELATSAEIKSALLKVCEHCLGGAPVAWRSVSAILRKIAETFKLVLFFDNIDRKESEFLETKVIMEMISACSEELSASGIAAIIAMRKSTYQSHEFQRTGIVALLHPEILYLLPADLIGVVRKRADWLRRRGLATGDEDWWFIDEIYDWVMGMQDVQADRNTNPLAYWIMRRHPHNVRGQLVALKNGICAAYAIAGSKTTLREGLLGRRGHYQSEFFLRALLVGQYSHFVDEDREAFALNMFNNKTPDSAYNGILRALVLDRIPPDREFTFEEVVAGFSETRIPIEEIISALGAFAHHSLIREAGDRTYPRRYSLTGWGEEFSTLWSDLSYTQVVWWDTPMLEGYSLGSPRPLTPSDLPSLARQFCLWIKDEETRVRSLLANDVDKIFTRSVYSRVSGDIEIALRKIQTSLRRRGIS